MARKLYGDLAYDSGPLRDALADKDLLLLKKTPMLVRISSSENRIPTVWSAVSKAP